MNHVDLAAIDLNLLVALDALLEEKNVTRAAKRLARTQSALSHSLRKLRDLFQDELFVAGQSGLTPTPRAEALRIPVRTLLTEIGALVGERPSFDPATSAQRFTLAASDYVAMAILPTLMDRLSTEGPRIDLHVKPTALAPADAVTSGEVDLAYAVSFPAPPGLQSRKLFTDRFVSVVRKSHPILRRPVDLEAFVSFAHVLSAPSGGREGFVDEALLARGHRRRIALVVPHFLVAPRIVARTDFILTVPERLAIAFCEDGTLRMFDPPVSVPPVAMHMLWHARRQKDPAHQWLRRMIAECVKS